MEGGKRTPWSVRKKTKRTNTRPVRSIVAYLQSDSYFFAPLFSKFSPLQMQMPPPSSFISSKADVKEVKKNKRRLSEKVKEYLNSDCHMYRPMISLPKPGSSLEGELRIKNLVTVEVSTSSATMREDNNDYRDLRSSDIAGHTFHSGRINSTKRELVILDGQRSRDQTDLSPALFHSTRGKNGEARSKESSN